MGPITNPITLSVGTWQTSSKTVARLGAVQRCSAHAFGFTIGHSLACGLAPCCSGDIRSMCYGKTKDDKRLFLFHIPVIYDPWTALFYEWWSQLRDVHEDKSWFETLGKWTKPACWCTTKNRWWLVLWWQFNVPLSPICLKHLVSSVVWSRHLQGGILLTLTIQWSHSRRHISASSVVNSWNLCVNFLEPKRTKLEEHSSFNIDCTWVER